MRQICRVFLSLGFALGASVWLLSLLMLLGVVVSFFACLGAVAMSLIFGGGTSQ